MPSSRNVTQCGVGVKPHRVSIRRNTGTMNDVEGTPNQYELGLDKVAANYTPLSPLSFIRRAASVYPERISVIHGEQRFTWAESYIRCRRLASALRDRGIGSGDTVAVMAPNIPAIFEAHFGVPMIGAVLNALNVRLDASTLAFILDHGGAKILIADREFSGVIGDALSRVKRKPLAVT